MNARRLLLGLVLVVPACAYKPPPPDPSLTVVRLTTVPPGAQVFIPRLGRGGMVTPMDLSREVRTSDRIRITKEGYDTWEGQLHNLWTVAEGCYKLKLRRSTDR